MYTDRISKIQNELCKTPLSCLLVTNFYNILYLTGFNSLSPEEREAYLLITGKDIYFFTDGRYENRELTSLLGTINAQFRCIEIGKGLLFHLKEIINTDLLKKLYFEKEDLKFHEFETLKQLPVELMALEQPVTRLRELKDKQELSFIEKACELTDTCLEDLIPYIKPGITEKELAWKMEQWIRTKGYELAFDSIIAVDKNSAVPHYATKYGNGTVKDGSMILIDYGVRYNNYNADSTRMIFVGTQSDLVVSTYNTLLNAQLKAIETIKKDVMLSEIDYACRNHLKTNRLPDFPHSTGHGVGLEVHETPRVSKLSKDIVRPNQVITIEPGVYYPNSFGMRIEDTVALSDANEAKILTKFSKVFLQI